VDFQSFVGPINLRNFNIVQLCIFFLWISHFNGGYAENSVQNRLGSFTSLFGLSAILKIRCAEHAHYLQIAAARAWNREKQMFVAKGKEFDKYPFFARKPTWCFICFYIIKLIHNFLSSRIAQ